MRNPDFHAYAVRQVVKFRGAATGFPNNPSPETHQIHETRSQSIHPRQRCRSRHLRHRHLRLGGNAITLTGNITDNFVGTETLNFNIATTAVRTVTTATGSTPVLGGNVSGTGGGLIAAGTGTLNLTGANTYTGATQVNSTVNITGTGVLGYSTSGTSNFSSITLGTGSSSGTLNQSTGTINAASLTMNNALGKRGIYNLSGGTLAVRGTAVVGQRNDTGTAFNLSGSGILTASSLIVAGIGNNNASTYGTFTQSGGTATVGSLTLAQSSTDNTPNVHQGTYNLNGDNTDHR
jgi:fibronectin-binding autotransporter adhesin